MDEEGQPISYSDYANFRGALIQRMGQYCSYCDQKLPASLAVEHVQPKSLTPELEVEWTNFLLGCANCNSSKGDTPINLDDYLWPDIHNTHMAYVYNSDGSIDVSADLEPEIQHRAQNTLDLVGLQKNPNRPSVSDRRWKNRTVTFNKAFSCRLLVDEAVSNGNDLNYIVSLIGELAPESGFFSIWFKAFTGYPTVQEVLVENFIGTDRNAFDENLIPKKRTEVL
ncbi:HNH endonuclease [Roseivirga sp. BDSF3-8]|uniref:HNH endonuclease n=1 Tax=Roseivirga sp. BDSF3-8 TaxID=3241598 RepID=UPI00353237E4